MNKPPYVVVAGDCMECYNIAAGGPRVSKEVNDPDFLKEIKGALKIAGAAEK